MTTDMHNHLGDGAYCEFTGYDFIFRANSHTSMLKVHVDPNGMIALAGLIAKHHPELAKAMAEILGETE